MKNKVYAKMLEPRVKRGECFNILTGVNERPLNDYNNNKKNKELRESPYAVLGSIPV